MKIPEIFTYHYCDLRNDLDEIKNLQKDKISKAFFSTLFYVGLGSTIYSTFFLKSRNPQVIGITLLGSLAVVVGSSFGFYRLPAFFQQEEDPFRPTAPPMEEAQNEHLPQARDVNPVFAENVHLVEEASFFKKVSDWIWHEGPRALELAIKFVDCLLSLHALYQVQTLSLEIQELEKDKAFLQKELNRVRAHIDVQNARHEIEAIDNSVAQAENQERNLFEWALHFVASSQLKRRRNQLVTRIEEARSRATVSWDSSNNQRELLQLQHEVSEINRQITEKRAIITQLSARRSMFSR